MALAGLPRVASRLPVDNPLLDGVVKHGTVELAPGVEVEVGASFVWWRPEPGRGKELGRVVGAAPVGALPARVVLVVWVSGGPHEVVAFVSEVEVWVAPPRPRAASVRKFTGERIL